MSTVINNHDSSHVVSSINFKESIAAPIDSSHSTTDATKPLDDYSPDESSQTLNLSQIKTLPIDGDTTERDDQLPSAPSGFDPRAQFSLTQPTGPHSSSPSDPNPSLGTVASSAPQPLSSTAISSEVSIPIQAPTPIPQKSTLSSNQYLTTTISQSTNVTVPPPPLQPDQIPSSDFGTSKDLVDNTSTHHSSSHNPQNPPFALPSPISQDAHNPITPQTSESGDPPRDQLSIDLLPGPSKRSPPSNPTSLSPLSDLPSGLSSSHVTQPLLAHPSSISPSSPRPSHFPKRPSPMSENMAPAQPTHHSSQLNIIRDGLNGESMHKRPRLSSDQTSASHEHLSTSIQQKPVTAQIFDSSNPSAAPNSLINQSALNLVALDEGLVPGGPGTRLTKDQHRFALSVIKQLKKHRLAAPFLLPVDVVGLNIPDYPKIVKQPMDLTTIETRLGKVGKPCYYRSVEQFVSDVQLIFTNCYTFNGPPEASPYSRMALDLSIQFQSQMKKMPADDHPDYPAINQSPIQSKPLIKPKQPFDSPTNLESLQNKIAPPAVASLPPNNIATGGQKRRSSLQHTKKKAPKTTSYSTPGLQNADLSGNATQYTQQVGPSHSRRSSINADSASSQRLRREMKDSDYRYDGATEREAEHLRCGASVIPNMVPNTKAELKFCKDVLREVNKKVYEKFVWPFYTPVDIVKLGIPDYPKIVKKPMDLHTMKQKLDRGEYKNGAAFADDFRLMLNNCFIFNPIGTPVNTFGKQLECLFEAKWAERPAESVPAPAPPPPVTLAPSESQHDMDPIQMLQIQVAQLQEKLQLQPNAAGPVHSIPGTGPPKKQSHSRGPIQSKSLPGSNVAGVQFPSSGPSAAPRVSKSNGASLNRSKSAAGAGGARRKSSAQTPASAKRLSQPPEQFVDRQQVMQAPIYSPAPDVSTSAPPISNSARGLGSDDYFEKIDYEQKKDLATQIQNAVEPMQSDAINLIRNSRPDLVAADGEEIELDIDALDDRTLYRLYQLVCAPPPPALIKKKKAAKSNAANGKAKGAKASAAAGAPRRSGVMPPPTQVTPHTFSPTNPPQSLANVEVGVPSWPQSAMQSSVTNGNGSKAKTKKPRATDLGLRRKGIDESQEAARIKDLEQRLHAFQGVADACHNHNQQHQNGPGTMPATAAPIGSANSNHPPPAGPVEYASSSSESDSESDDESD
ncbi:hypothetical protein O181_030606 [Austropuccinia psidii MF-1]|uniref:Bromodomain-containing protein n=1 Tax=Austropuccinia psidii MF-1 TaxID=1389203 RepID=A0A9Q3CTA5_9BASI|nr:hypothetical protein [Austropuccinia psidii MF-1]